MTHSKNEDRLRHSDLKLSVTQDRMIARCRQQNGRTASIFAPNDPKADQSRSGHMISMNNETSTTQRRPAVGSPRRRRMPASPLPPEGLREEAMSEGAGALDWCALVPRLVHETKVCIIEAMRWIDRPLSAREMERISGGCKSIADFEHHFLSLVKAGGISRVSRTPVRGAHENHYFFTEAVRCST
jgi:hypothetical protein